MQYFATQGSSHRYFERPYSNGEMFAAPAEKIAGKLL
jgi:hypothetical protein